MIVINPRVRRGVSAQVKRAVGREREQNPGQSIILLSAFSVNQRRKPSMNEGSVTRLFSFSDYPNRSLTPGPHQAYSYHPSIPQSSPLTYTHTPADFISAFILPEFIKNSISAHNFVIQTLSFVHLQTSTLYKDNMQYILRSIFQLYYKFTPFIM